MGGYRFRDLFGVGVGTRLKAYLMASVVARTRSGRTARTPQGMCAAQVAVFGICAGTYLPPGNSERGDRLWLTGEDQAHSDSMGLAYGTIPISPTPAGTLTPASSSSNRRFVPTDPGPGATPMGMNFRASPGATGDGERGAGKYASTPGIRRGRTREYGRARRHRRRYGTANRDRGRG